MPHGAIIGLTTSGKTFLARQLARAFKKAGIKVMALRKPREEWGKDECDFQTFEPDTFLAEYEKQKRENWKTGNSTVAFLEFSDSGANKYDVKLRKLATEGRHDGFRFFFLAQRGAQVHPDIRENCVSLYLFTCGGDAAETWSSEFADKDILQAATLPQNMFLHKPSRYAKAVIRKLKV